MKQFSLKPDCHKLESRVIYYFPDVAPPQIPLPVLHIGDDFVGLLAHLSHVQLRLVAVTFTDMLVQTAPRSVAEAVEEKQVYFPPREEPERWLFHC